MAGRDSTVISVHPRNHPPSEGQPGQGRNHRHHRRPLAADSLLAAAPTEAASPTTGSRIHDKADPVRLKCRSKLRPGRGRGGRRAGRETSSVAGVTTTAVWGRRSLVWLGGVGRCRFLWGCQRRSVHELIIDFKCAVGPFSAPVAGQQDTAVGHRGLADKSVVHRAADDVERG